MNIVFNEHNMHEISNPVSGKNKEPNINLASTELAKRVVKVKYKDLLCR